MRKMIKASSQKASDRRKKLRRWNEDKWSSQAQKLLDQESALAEDQAQQLELDKKTVSHYAKLDVDEIKELVVIDKWFDRLSADVAAEVERVTQVLATAWKNLKNAMLTPFEKKNH